jgi:chaperonin GroES
MTESANTYAGPYLAVYSRTFFDFACHLEEGDRTMALRPLHDNVVVKRIDPEEEMSGGIIIPDTAKEKPSEGEVLAVGPGKLMDNGERRPMAVQAGNRVLFGKYAGTEVTLDGDELLILRESDLHGVIE